MRWVRCRRGLEAAVKILKPGGRLVVITFHSVEDRVVKEFGRRLSRDYEPAAGVDVPELRRPRPPLLQWVRRKAIVPGEEELRENPRSRSAQCRVLEKLEDSQQNESVKTKAWPETEKMNRPSPGPVLTALALCALFVVPGRRLCLVQEPDRPARPPDQGARNAPGRIAAPKQNAARPTGHALFPRGFGRACQEIEPGPGAARACRK